MDRRCAGECAASSLLIGACICDVGTNHRPFMNGSPLQMAVPGGFLQPASSLFCPSGLSPNHRHPLSHERSNGLCSSRGPSLSLIPQANYFQHTYIQTCMVE
ncbi:hypothetical protein PAMP_005799 [Pampus punctatissimus]